MTHLGHAHLNSHDVGGALGEQPMTSLLVGAPKVAQVSAVL